MEVTTSLDDLANELGPNEVYLFISPESFKVRGEKAKVRGVKLNGAEALIEYFILLTSPLEDCYVTLLGKINHGLWMKGVYKIRNRELINVGLELFKKHGREIANQVGSQIMLKLNAILKKYRQEKRLSNELFLKSKIHYLNGEGFRPFVKEFDNLLSNYIEVSK